MFFGRAVSQLEMTGHEVMCTSRDYREVVLLAKERGLDMKIIGKHGGKRRADKLLASVMRTEKLTNIVMDFSPDIAISFASPEATRVAYGLGIIQTTFNDSPHSEAVGRLTVPLADKLMCPWVIPYTSWTRMGIEKRNITRYRALDPAAWLKHEKLDGQKKDRIIIRLEESSASYLVDNNTSSMELVDSIISILTRMAPVTILCRYQEQIDEMKKRYGDLVYGDVFIGMDILKEARLFIGAGGTMTAEAALMGVPTISIAPMKYDVENYLMRTGLVSRAQNKDQLLDQSKKLLYDGARHREKASKLLASMEDPTDYICLLSGNV